jgi:hypothetical protein
MSRRLAWLLPLKTLPPIAGLVALLLLPGFHRAAGQSKPGTELKTNPPAVSQEFTIGNQSAAEWPDPWPAPMPKPEGTPDEVAADLAKIVLNGGPDTLPALERAALESGFSIHDESGKVLFMPDDASDIGLSMLNFDLAIASENTKTKKKILISDLERGIHENDELKDISLPDAFADTMKANLDEFHAGLRFWAQFVSSLSSQSDGDYDAVAVCDDDSEISGPQATWLLYLSAGQAAAGLMTPAEQPDNPPLGSHLAVPPSDANMRQGTNIPAFRDLSRSLTQQQRSTIAQKIQQSQSHLDPQIRFLNEVLRLARNQFVQIEGNYYNPPLIHAKVFDQLGGEMHLKIVPILKVPAKFRAKYQAAMATVPGANPMPPDGPLKLADVRLEEDDLFTVAQKGMDDSGASLILQGTKQERHLVANPVAEDFTIPSVGLVTYADPAFGFERIKTNVPYRDWHNPGGLLSVMMTVHGSGTLKNPEGGVTMHWTINRKAESKALLIQSLPIAMYAIGGAKQGDASVLSWVTSFDPNVNPTSWKFMIDDETTITAPIGGCATKEGETTTATDTVKDRAPSAEEREFLKVIGAAVQIDKAKKPSFHATTPAAPVKRKSSGNTPRNDTMDMLEDVDVTPPPGVRLDHGIEVDDAGGSGAISIAVSGKLAGYDTWRGNAGDHQVAITITYRIQSAAQTTTPPDQQATLSLQQIKHLLALQSRRLLVGSTSNWKLGGSSSAILVNGPVWVRKGPAITCSEIVIRDKMPTKKKSLIGTK